MSKDGWFHWAKVYSALAGCLGLGCPLPIKVSLKMLRFHHILRLNKSFHTFLLISSIHLTPFNNI
ncbi:MAG: hypothetical protein ABSA71_13420 [Desulfomonilia bacterium]